MSNRFTEGYLDMYLNYLNCSGLESSVFDCPYNQSIDHSCNQYEDASVICQCKTIYMIILKIINVNELTEPESHTTNKYKCLTNLKYIVCSL